MKRCAAAAILAMAIITSASAQSPTVAAQPVTVDNFTRAESDGYFARFVGMGAFGKLVHSRELADVAKQSVVRMNRDTLYSQGVFDLDAGPVTAIMPETGGRFMSLLLINEDHYNPATFYTAGAHKITREQVGTRYVTLLFRTFVNPADPADMTKVHALQDAISIEQPGGPGKFEVPTWDDASRTKVRQALMSLGGLDANDIFGTKAEVDPVRHLIGTAAGWGGNPARDAKYISVTPENNDGTTVQRLTVKDVPVDAFWSISVYNKDGFFEPNALNAYSLNDVTAAKAKDGSYTIQFGGCGKGVANCLPITPGWNYTVRLYRPRAEALNGSWKFPEARPVSN
jgi:hypothetical protein